MYTILVLVLLPCLLQHVACTIPPLPEYVSTRATLVQAKYSESLSGSASLSAKEQLASLVFSKLMAQELVVMGDNYPPAMNFFESRGFIDNTSVVFPVIERMPKGAALHVHMSSAGSYGWVVANMTYSPYCYIYTNSDNASIPFGSLQFFGEQPPATSGWLSVNFLRSTSNNATTFDQEMLNNLTLIDKDYGDYLALWSRFDGLFAHFAGAFSYIECARGYIRHTFLEMIADGVLRLELRAPDPTFEMYDLDGRTYDYVYFIEMVQEIVVGVQQTVEPRFSCGLIVAIMRDVDVDTAYTLLEKSLILRNKYPGFILGADLVGPEDEGHSLEYFVPAFLAIQNISAAMKYDLPYFFHAGETVLANNSNLYDALLLATRRIGHGLQLAKHPALIRIVKSAHVAIEVCPISNQLLEYTPDMRLHPGYEYFNLGLPVTISPDDPAIYGYGGLSYDLYFACVGWALDLAGLKQLALNSLMHAAWPSASMMDTAHLAWRDAWDAWVDLILQQYGHILKN